MPDQFSRTDLEAFLDEALPVEMMSRIEQALRQDPELARSIAGINALRDAGVHSLGAIWRRNRLSCPSREELGSYLLGVLSEDAADYVSFHLQTIGCRYCYANVDDLKIQQSEP